MSRARNIKPGFFKNDHLAECEPLARLLFAGLWCEADREGRLEDRPKRLKADCLPYDDCDVDALLNELAGRGFIVRYEVSGVRYVAIPEFGKHQMPHHKEVASVIPPPPGQPAITRHTYDVSPTLRLAVFERDGNRCLCCGTAEELSLDHIIPLSKGGTNDESNLQTLCRRCNSAKGDTTKSYIKATSGQRQANVESSNAPLAPLIPDSPSLIPPSGEKPERSPKGSRLAADWQPSDADVAYAEREHPRIDWRRESLKFRNYWLAKAGKDARRLDWHLTWCNWLLKAEEGPAPRAGPGSAPSKQTVGLAGFLGVNPHDLHNEQSARSVVHAADRTVPGELVLAGPGRRAGG